MTPSQVRGIGALLAAPLLLCIPATAQETESAALATYKRYANAFMRGQFDLARRLAADQARAVVERKEALVRGGEAIVPITEPLFLIVSETPSADGRQVAIHAVQVVQPATAPGAFEPPALHRQHVTMTRSGETWKVVSFRDDLEKCCDP